MNYVPNFNDPRVLRRLHQAYTFARGCLSPNKPKAWSQNALLKNFGPNSSDLSAWLRSTLLVCTNNHYSMDLGKTKEYTLNPVGADFVRSVLYDKTPSDNAVTNVSLGTFAAGLSDARDLFDYTVVKNWVVREYGQQLSTGVFKYEDKADRLWNPIQNIRTKFRAPLLAEHGFVYDYDIQACAPTIIMQHAQRHGMDLWLPALTTYLKGRTEVRRRVAQVADIPEKDAKVLINALFCGARLGANRDFTLFHLLSQDAKKVHTLQADEFITQLRADIRTCWEYIEPTMTRIEVTNPRTGKSRKVPLSSKRKWARYFQLERSVLDVVRTELEKTGNQVFLEHDGWKTKNPVETQVLQEVIYQKTGFKVVIEEHSLQN